MAVPQMYAVNNGWLGIAKEATPGTAVDPVIYVPLMSPEWAPKPVYLLDNSLVGSPVVHRDVVLGTIYYEFTMKMFLFADVLPYLFVNLLGGTDTVTGTTSPFTHTIGLINNTTGSQPPTFTVTWFDGHQIHQMVGCMLSKFDVAMKIDAAVECTLLYLAQSENNTTKAIGSYNAYHEMPSWSTTFLLGTAQSLAVEEFDVSFERTAQAVFGAGQQSARSIFQGPLKVSGKYLAFYDSNDPLAPNLVPDSLSRNLLATKATFLDTVTTFTFAIQMSNTQFMNPTLPVDKEYLGSAAEFEAVGNSTDATSGGISDAKVIVTNGIATPAST